jgi:hypothetical protein
MQHKPLARPRKLPKQERSQGTVEAILTATTHILTEEGNVSSKDFVSQFILLGTHLPRVKIDVYWAKTKVWF